MTLSVNKINYSQTTYTNNNKKNNNKANSSEKIFSAIGSTLGVGIAMSAITKKNPLKLVKTINKPKKLLEGIKKIELNDKDVIEIATSSIAGGLVAGSAIDRENTKAKAKEGITQLVGNYIVPSLFVSGGIKLNKVLNNKFKYPPKTGLMKFTFGMLSLVAGVFAGNTISKGINSKIFKEESYRPLSWKDWGMQVDNVCLVTSMANEGTTLAQTVSKIIPIAHLIPGYLTGTKKENN